MGCGDANGKVPHLTVKKKKEELKMFFKPEFIDHSYYYLPKLFSVFFFLRKLKMWLRRVRALIKIILIAATRADYYL